MSEYGGVFGDAYKQGYAKAIEDAAKVADSVNYAHSPELTSGELWMRDTIVTRIKALLPKGTK